MALRHRSLLLSIRGRECQSGRHVKVPDEKMVLECYTSMLSQKLEREPSRATRERTVALRPNFFPDIPYPPKRDTYSPDSVCLERRSRDAVPVCTWVCQMEHSDLTKTRTPKICSVLQEYVLFRR